MSKAKVVEVNGKRTPNGTERVARIKMGEKGAGKQVGPSVVFWPWSSRSCEEARKIIQEVAHKNDLELIEEEAE